VLDDIAIGPVAEQPAGEVAPPLAVRAGTHIELNKSTDFLEIFPRRAGFACLEPHDRVADAQRFARLHRQVAGQAVALVEQADHRDPVAHRRAGQGGRAAIADPAAFYFHRAGLVGNRHVIVAARGKRQRDGEKRQGRT
jgi:hypothetical protein